MVSAWEERYSYSDLDIAIYACIKTSPNAPKIYMIFITQLQII